MSQEIIDDIQLITAPFANTWEHVQGPGGNTSVKNQDIMLIKASGFTFKDLINGIGLTWVDNNQVIQNLSTSCNDGSLECPPAKVIKSIPEGLRPSMEFEFHAALGKYVLHTHSIYVNVITCCVECPDLLKTIFWDIPYVLVPYIMPGHPLASYIYKMVASGEKAQIYFLKNHGVIVHAETVDEVLSIYNLIQQRIIDFLKLSMVMEDHSENTNLESKQVLFEEISNGIDQMKIEDVRDHILVPDQSIFFRNKIAATDTSASVYFDLKNKEIVINGSPKFMEAAESMLKMIYYILSNHSRLALTSEFISKKELDILHGLSSEKYRVSIL